jgi:two-component system chemotaxis response regulator CheY
MATILSVDDSDAIRQMIVLILSNAGYTVEESSDGEQALTVAKSKQFDLILTDFNMPKMNGLELIKALRSEPSYRYTPILMLTTEDEEGMKKQGRSVGATGWLVKPFDAQKLVASVKRAIGAPSIYQQVEDQ